MKAFVFLQEELAESDAAGLFHLGMLCDDLFKEGVNGKQRVFGAGEEKGGCTFDEFLITESFFGCNIFQLLQHHVHRFGIGRGEYLHQLFLQG